MRCVIRLHPLGGFAVVDCSDILGDRVPPATNHHQGYISETAAKRAAIEMGYLSTEIHVHPEVYEEAE